MYFLGFLESQSRILNPNGHAWFSLEETNQLDDYHWLYESLEEAYLTDVFCLFFLKTKIPSSVGH